MKQNVIEGNRLIANSPFAEQSDKDHISHYVDSGNEIGLEQYYMLLDYHKNWSKLMPVVEKIESLQLEYAGDKIKNFSFMIRNSYCVIEGYTGVRQPGVYYQTPYGANPESKILAVYDGVIQFITWYNSQK